MSRMRVRLAPGRALQCIALSHMIRNGYNSIYISHMNPRCPSPPSSGPVSCLVSASGLRLLSKIYKTIDPHRSKIHTTGTTANVTCHVLFHIYSSKVKFTSQINFSICRCYCTTDLSRICGSLQHKYRHLIPGVPWGNVATKKQKLNRNSGSKHLWV